MDYVTLGRSGLTVSRACLGAMMFGHTETPTNEADSRRIIDAFLDGGGNFIDTANVYTGGQSEEVVGRAIKAKRDDVVLATKGFGPIGEGPNTSGLGRKYLTRALDASLARLDTDYVDLYQCHRPDPSTPVEETMATLDGFVQAGKVRYIGCSNWTGSQIVEAQWAAARNGGTPFVSLQPRYSLTSRQIEEDVLPACERHGLGTMVYSPLGGGVLTGKYKKGEAPPVDSRAGRGGVWARMLDDRSLDIADTVGKVAAELGTTSTALAIAWVLARRGVTTVIIGPRTFDQYEQNMEGFDLQLTPEVVKQLSDASRPPR
ncbi:MAG TPA: aldo/keto reductase [Acidimicrobiales bacterium]|jgi:aryl-alcohol dehydrogenase-like predicted oxidoreductase